MSYLVSALKKKEIGFGMLIIDIVNSTLSLYIHHRLTAHSHRVHRQSKFSLDLNKQ